MSKKKKVTPQSPSVALINLGCARNTVDGQVILGRLFKKNFRLLNAPHAECVIVNTCTFIEDAKKESIDVILDLIRLKKKGAVKHIIIAGCLAQRYGKELLGEFKEIDAISGVVPLEKNEPAPQISLTPAHYSYVKICESCINCCSFCVIPHIKGAFRSRTTESIINEAVALDQKGVKEINIIGQDITAYGKDLYGSLALARLLKELLRCTKRIKWFRLLYAFPSRITDELLDLIAAEKRLCSYIDLPLQHINDKILKRMNRRITKKEIIQLITKIRSKIPGCYLRTTFIVGFPGETQKAFEELLDFVRDVQFERVGVFMFSREEGTPAFKFSNRVPPTVKQKRFNQLMQVQKEISERLHERLIGKRLEVLIDEKQKAKENIYIGRSQYDAPDVDGVVYVKSKKPLRIGKFINVHIIDSLEYDLLGEAK